MGNITSPEAAKYRNDLYQCWEKYGVDHEKCSHLVTNFDKGFALELNLQENYKRSVKQYPSFFNNMMAPQPDKMYFKGRRSTGFWLTNRSYGYPKY